MSRSRFARLCGHASDAVSPGVIVNALDVVYGVVALAMAPWWARKTRSGWGERFARVTPKLPPPDPARPRIMLHAVSVGEVNALRELTPLLSARAQVVVTAGTDTGLARARALFEPGVTVARYPLDASWAVRRFLDAVRPDVVGLVELEVWPNFLAACAARSIPVAVINGRLSARSFRGYRRLRRWITPTFASLTTVCAQNEEYAGRFAAMGVPRARIRVTGSMKFDSARIEDDVPGADALARELAIDRSRPLIVAGSTGPGEEALLHEVWRTLGGPSCAQLLCAPRKPERFDEAAGALPGCVRRSAGGTRAGADLFLLDTIGELRGAYALADLVVVGRSFFDLHGSDPIEPVALGRATVIGPEVSDFEQIVAALEAAGGLVRADRGTLAEVLGGLLRDEPRRRALAERGRACIRGLQGASARHAEVLMELARP